MYIHIQSSTYNLYLISITVSFEGKIIRFVFKFSSYVLQSWPSFYNPLRHDLISVH